ncbi:tyrosinase family oxidase copper chaperone [Streptomyces physcomitrii]|uniref:tyrosinase family oxidase copper chaperone n=1 Tax=Streptomyces physcomitrii TaxID=2724184 RepID=UPI0033BFBE35
MSRGPGADRTDSPTAQPPTAPRDSGTQPTAPRDSGTPPARGPGDGTAPTSNSLAGQGRRPGGKRRTATGAEAERSPLRLPTRRAALRSLFLAGPAVGVAGALSPLVLTRGEGAGDGTVQAPGGGAARPVAVQHGPQPDGEILFEETFRGRRLRATALPGGRAAVTVDGRPLHLMRRVDGTWLSMLDHYESYPSPRAAARAAVLELGTTALA